MPVGRKIAMNRLIFLLLLLLMSGLSILSGCDENRVIREGEVSPGLTGIDLNGNRVDPAQYKGKVIVLYFWHSSCCADKLEQLDKIYTHLKDKGLVIIATNAMDSREYIAAIAQRYSLKLPLLCDVSSENLKTFGVFGHPTYFIIDRDGIVRKRILGSIEPEQLKKLIEPYMV
jgi:peroxiredoxin